MTRNIQIASRKVQKNRDLVSLGSLAEDVNLKNIGREGGTRHQSIDNGRQATLSSCLVHQHLSLPEGFTESKTEISGREAFLERGNGCLDV